jgi:hypothetical protein
MASEGYNDALEQALRTELTYNYQLWPYDARIDGRLKNQIIRLKSHSHKVSTANREKAVQEAYTSANRPGIVPATNVLDIKDKSYTTAVVVGVRPCYSLTECNGPQHDNKTLQEPRQKGHSVQDMKPVEALAHDPTALRVVCPRGDGKDAVYYALTSQDRTTKLCDAVQVFGKEVFFFPEFRNDKETSKQGRMQAWGEKVRAMLGNTVSIEPKEVGKIPVLLERNISTNLASF